mgnify:CR=1 FL=1
MQFREKAEVLTSEGEKAGRLIRLVVDPRAKELTHLVLQKGLLFTEDKVVPLQYVDFTADDQIVLKKGAGDPEQLPPFEEINFTPLGDRAAPAGLATSGIPSMTWYYPWAGSAWWHAEDFSAFAKPQYAVSSVRNIPEDTVPLEEGGRVISADEVHVGDIERLYADPEENRVTHLLVSRGLIIKEKKLIPSFWIDTVVEDEVQLTVESTIVDNLPDYSDKM